MDNKTCKCSRLFRNLKSRQIKKIELSSFNKNNKYLLFLDWLHNNKISLNLINNLNNYFGYGLNFCVYPRKLQIVAFLMESITLIGFGHFYLYRFFQGLFKFGLLCSLILSIFIYNKIRSINKSNKSIFFEENKNPFNHIYEQIFKFLCFMNYIFVMSFHIFDIYMLANNYYNDGFGFKLISWNSYP